VGYQDTDERRLMNSCSKIPPVVNHQLISTCGYGITSVIEQRFDVGIRRGESISKDMIAVRIGPDWRLAVVGSPAYFERKPAPATPRELTAHECVNIRHRPSGAIYAWEFE